MWSASDLTDLLNLCTCFQIHLVSVYSTMCDSNDILRMCLLQLPTTNQNDYNYKYTDVIIFLSILHKYNCNCNDYRNVECYRMRSCMGITA